MAHTETVWFTYEKRGPANTTTGEYERAEMTGVLQLDEGDAIDQAVDKLTGAVRSRVRELVDHAVIHERFEPAEDQDDGSTAAAHYDTPPEQPAPRPTPAAREKPAPSHPGVQLPTGTSKVRGHNATNLANQLIECVGAGLEIPEAQLNRLPKAQYKEVREYIDNYLTGMVQEPGVTEDQDFADAKEGFEADPEQEPAGSHDDPEPGALRPGAQDADGVDKHGQPDPSQEIERDGTEGTPAAEPDTALLDGETGDAPAEGDGTDVLADIEAEAPEPEITDGELMEYMRDAANRAGQASKLKAAVQEYTADGRRLGTIPQAQRPAFKRRVEELIQGNA